MRVNSKYCMNTIYFFKTFHPDGVLTFYSKSRLVSFRNRLYEAEDSAALYELATIDLSTASSLHANVFMLPFFFDHSAIVKCSARWIHSVEEEGFVFFLRTTAVVCGALVYEGVHVLLARLQRWFRKIARVRIAKRRESALAFAMSGHGRLGEQSVDLGDTLGIILQMVVSG